MSEDFPSSRSRGPADGRAESPWERFPMVATTGTLIAVGLITRQMLKRRRRRRG